MKPKFFHAIGLMSGTSIDGIDAALVETDGVGHVHPLGFVPSSYDADFRARLRRYFGRVSVADDAELRAFEHELTMLHADMVRKLLHQVKIEGDVDVIGFHGQTLSHRPKEKLTFQIGDGALLAAETGIPVINDFRSADVLAGGQGAPLVPLYHRARAAALPKPVAILNVGGVSNITWIGGERDEDIIAFDVGFGNAPLDDWILHMTGKPYDEDGALAATGAARQELVDKMLQNAFFGLKPPKSLDRDAFVDLLPPGLSAADGAATITRMMASCVAKGLELLPQKPTHLYVSGGGRHNRCFMRFLAEMTDIPVGIVEELGWSGDGLEAEAFAYLAVRSYLGLPLSVPGTTGVPQPITGGRFHKPVGSRKSA